MSHDPLCVPPWSYGKGGYCEGCDLIAQARADQRERIAVQLEEWADDPTSDQPPARSIRFTLAMAARAIRRWEQQ